ncbi:MAG: OadG family protein [Prolixibacteraceae bacterium]|jgi:oxaloacetate decarboxylase gamma subunit|nr:OadG family protein [Prolixibacteraceae bacterium]
MSENFELALQLLGIGMGTVFIILFLVILIGNTIIKFVNRFIPEAQKVIRQNVTSVLGITSPEKMAAIVSAVQIVTGGKGKVTSINKE